MGKIGVQNLEAGRAQNGSFNGEGKGRGMERGEERPPSAKLHYPTGEL